MPLTQENKDVYVSTGNSEDILLIKTMTGTERLGRPFTYHLELYSENHEIDFNEIIGESMTVTVMELGGETRHFNGLVSDFEQIPSEPVTGLARYRATLVPWFWFLTRTSNSRIFQNMSVPDIILQVFREHGFSDFENALTEKDVYEARKREYCVQYNETDFNFISRLMEEEGIYYFFEHQDGLHTLVLADSPCGHYGGPGNSTEIPMIPKGGGNLQHNNSIWYWSLRMNARTGRLAMNAFDYEDPKKDLKVQAGIARDHAMADFEIFEYPGEHKTHDDGEHYARVRLEEFHTLHQVASGEGNASHLGCGACFQLTRAQRQDQNQEYLVTSARYEIRSDQFYSQDRGTEEVERPTYLVRFTAMPVTEAFRPARVTPRPIIPGPQTAIVVGKDGEEIWTDKLGRVKVKFHWDRYSTADENSSCWVRVSQFWAGKKFGAIFLPRIGHEVIVEFLNGDPDRPIITGCVYNEDNRPATPLPKNKLASGIRSNFSPNDNDRYSASWIAFFDEKDGRHGINIVTGGFLKQVVHEECIFNFEDIYDITVEKDKKEHVKGNRHERVGKNHMEAIGGDYNLSVKGKMAKKIEGSQSLQVTGDVIEVYSGNHSEQCGSYELTAKDVTINGASKVTLKAGGASIEIASGIITLTAGLIKLDAPIVDATAIIKAGALVQTPAVIAQSVVSPSYTPGAGNIL